ncbi:MAG: hypothetical protein IJT27_03415 [Clostridia bacterium]|nr:hypothetical protein [Clostridia bacterium]
MKFDFEALTKFLTYYLDKLVAMIYHIKEWIDGKPLEDPEEEATEAE